MSAHNGWKRREGWIGGGLVLNEFTKILSISLETNFKIQTLEAVWMQIFHHSISITHHSLLITYYSSLKIPYPFGTITQYFSHCLWTPYLSLSTIFFFFPVPKLTEPNEKRKKERNPETRTQWKKKEKKVRTKDRTQEKKGEKNGQKVRLWVPPCVFNYKSVIKLWVMETKNWK